MRFIERLRMPGLLSFPPDMDFFDLKSLNVLIGPNASGKSNFIDTLRLLSALPTNNIEGVMRWGVREWLWKGADGSEPAVIEVETRPFPETGAPLRYRLSFDAPGYGLRIVDESLEDVHALEGYAEPSFYYRRNQGPPVINVRMRTSDGGTERMLQQVQGLLDQSVFYQRKDPDLYPELHWLGWHFNAIQMFSDWTFGSSSPPRQPQPADSESRGLVFDARNLAVMLNKVVHKRGPVFDEHLKRLFPRFERLSIDMSGGAIQLYLHESRFGEPIPATRLSDGTLRFLAVLSILLSPEPEPPAADRLVCIEEPELGLHADATSDLADLLVDASERMQLVVTTHSDALVSALSGHPDAIITCERLGDGTELRRLDPQRLAEWLEEYQLGDLWRMGELGANP